MPDRTVAPPVAHFSDIVLQPRKTFTLPNGIDINLVNHGSLPLSRMALVWDGGLLDYPSKATNMVLATTIQEATRKMSGAEVADMIDFCGARVSGGISNHHTSLEMVAINSSFKRLLPLLADFSREASFPENAVEASKMRIAANRRIQFERVSYIASVQLHALLQGATHPASNVALPEDIESVNRRMVTDRYDDLRRSRLHIFVGGMLSDELIENVAATFSELPESDISPVKIIPFNAEPPQRTDIDRPESVQSAVAMGFPAVDRSHPDYIALRLAVMALGGYFGSRLMTNIREEKGLTYGINAATLGTHEGAFIEISAQCDRRYVEQVIDETVKEIENLGVNPPCGDELNRLRRHAWSQLATAADSAFGTLEHYMTELRVGTSPTYFREQLDTIASLTPEKIAEMARLYLRPERMSVVTAGSRWAD